MKNIVTIVLSILTINTAFSQTVDSTPGLLRTGVSVVQYQMPCNLNLDSGNDILWDLSAQETTQSRRMKLTSRPGTSNSIAISDRLTTSYLRLSGDSLFYDGYESNLAKMNYHGGIPIVVFPMHYGDSLTHDFDGVGSYSDDWKMECFGRVRSKIDARGVVITPEADTIRNVLRIHITRHSNNKIIPKGGTEVDVQCSHAIEDDYLWYAPGYRYPVLHANIYTEEGNSESYLWYTPLYEQESLAVDDENLAIRQTGTDGSAIDETGEGGAESPLHYTLRNNPGEKRVTVFYDQSVDGTVTFILSDVRGTVYSSRSQTHDAGTGYSAEISLAGLRSGSYVLYICMDNQRYAETVLVK